MVYFNDHLTLDAPKRLQGGYMAVRAKAARTGTYDYAGVEIDPDNTHGLRDTPVVKVLRDEATVFDKGSVHSFIGKPITDNHPSVAVDSTNWKEHARGTIMGAKWEAGDYLAFDLLLTDAGAIAKVDGGKRELSNGYTADLEFGDFTAPDGTKCQARQTKIFGNHVALVDKGRAGSECAIKDVAVCDAITADRLNELKALTYKETVVKTITLDGLPVKLDDAEAVEAAFNKLTARADDAAKALTDAQSAHDKAMADKDAKIADLETKVVDQAAIDKLADEKAEVVQKAKAVCGDKLADTAGKTAVEVRRMALDAQSIDVTDKSDDYVEARFDALTADSKQPVENLTPSRPVNDSGSVVESLRLARHA